MRTASPFALALAVLALAGCGGTSGPGSGGGSAETEFGDTGAQTQEAPAPGVENDPTYIEAGNICVNLPIEQLAVQYGTEADPEKVAAAVAASYPAAEREKAKLGCLQVLEHGG
jgi:hypothetical protein